MVSKKSKLNSVGVPIEYEGKYKVYFDFTVGSVELGDSGAHFSATIGLVLCRILGKNPNLDVKNTEKLFSVQL